LEKGYAQELYSFWIASPALGWVQLALLVVAWTHGCFGIAFWLRLKPWFPPLRPALLSLALLLPVLALLGYLHAGREVVALARDPVWRAEATAVPHTGTTAQSAWLADLRNGFLVFDGGALMLIVLARLLRGIVDRRRGRVCISYPDGRRQYVPLGFSVFEASLLAGIPHAGLCGARARCSLCRVRVLGSAAASLPEVDEPERRVLARLSVDPAFVRLGCQLRPINDISVLPLVPPNAQRAFLDQRQSRTVPRERFVALLVADMRGSTQLVATRLPHDGVFILGRFVAAVSAAALEAGGVPNQFLGDGVLAIFGLRCDPRTACRQAIAAVGLVARNIRQLNAALSNELTAPLAFGISVHCGGAVLGKIGFRDHVVSTVLGDVPNVASRLESLARDLGREAVISDDALRTAELSGAAWEPHVAHLRGREEPVSVRLLRHAEPEIALGC
jgi:adenylate cyclase